MNTRPNDVFSLLHLAYLDSEADEAVRQYETDPEFRQQVDRVVNRLVAVHSTKHGGTASMQRARRIDWVIDIGRHLPQPILGEEVLVPTFRDADNRKRLGAWHVNLADELLVPEAREVFGSTAVDVEVIQIGADPDGRYVLNVALSGSSPESQVRSLQIVFESDKEKSQVLEMQFNSKGRGSLAASTVAAIRLRISPVWHERSA